MKVRVAILLLSGALFSVPFVRLSHVEAQQGGKVYRIGFLTDR